MYNTDTSPTHEDISGRLFRIYELKERWGQITADFYGDDVAEQLKAIAPADPYLLYDMAVLALEDDEDKTEDEAIKTVDGFSKDEWQQMFNSLEPTITKGLKLIDKQAKKVMKKSKR